jgi:hypothetical protein
MSPIDYFDLPRDKIFPPCEGVQMSSHSEDDRKRDRKDKKKKKKKKDKKKHKTEHVEPVVAPAMPAPAAAAPVAPPPDLSKMTAEEKRKLLAAGRGARKAAYVGTEIGGPQQAKFKKFLRLSAADGEAQQAQQYDPGAGSAATPERGEKLEEALSTQFNKSLDYHFGGGGGAGGQRRGLGSK